MLKPSDSGSSPVRLLSVSSSVTLILKDHKVTVGDDPHISVDYDTEESQDEPQTSGQHEFLDKQHDRRVYHGDQETHGQHDSKHDPWQHQVVVSLKCKHYYSLIFKKPRVITHLKYSHDHQQAYEDGHAQINGQDDLNDTGGQPIEHDGFEIYPGHEHDDQGNDGQNNPKDTGDQGSSP